MNQTENYRNTILKAFLLLALCFLAISAGNNRDTALDSCSHSVLTSVTSQKSVQAIPVEVTNNLPVIHELIQPFIHSLHSEICKAFCDSYLAKQQLFVLRKSQEKSTPYCHLISYLSLLRIDQTDTPDLSQI